MNIEQNLKDMIISRYGSVKEFTTAAGIPNSSFVSIVNRGINTANISSLSKICEALNISMDELCAGRIAPVTAKSPRFAPDVASSVNILKYGLKSLDTLEIDGIPLQDTERRMLYAMLDGVVDVLRNMNR